MIKKSKKLLTLMFAFALAFVFGISTSLAAPGTITIKASDYTKDFLNSEHNNAMFMYKTTDGVTIYCMDIDKKPVLQGQTANLTGDADAGTLYILKNGYPNKSYRNNNGMDAYITQMALWWHLSDAKVSNNFKNTPADQDKYSLVSATRQLKDLAKKATAPQEPTMSVNEGTKVLTLTSDGKYYESSYMSATVTGTKTYNVELSGATKNTVIVDEGNNIGATMNSGEKFKIRIPVAEVTKDLKIGVKFNATARVEKAKIYTPSDTSYQRVVGIFPEDKNLAKNVELTLTKKRVCEYDQTTKKYYGKDGSEVTEAQYKEQCKHVCEYTNNKYYGKNGTEVTKEQFNKECNKSCEYDQENNTYYGKDGSVVKKEEFEKQCKRVCEYVDGIYYGKDGTAVDQNTYNSQCGEEVIVPSTGANFILWTVLLGVIAIAGGTGIILYRGNKAPIKK